MVLLRYSHLLMEESLGSVHVRTTLPDLAAALSPVGLEGAAFGVALRRSDAAPTPLAFTAATRNP